ncbi:MAG: PKD domain-containing protein [Bacteroidota bacterium]
MKKGLLLLMTVALSVWSHAQDSMSVLFIGNSYTYANDLPNMTRLLAESMGKQLTVGSKTNGGYTFQNHTNDPLTWAAMHQQNWDVVVLQAQSQEPSFPDDQVDTGTIPFAKQLADSVAAINPCSNVLYYMTWGRENGDPQWAPISTFAGMNERLYNAYMRMADTTESMVAAVGATWKYVRDNNPAIQLYVADGSHPSVAGTYLVACTFYTSLFQTPITGATYTAGLDAQTVAQLQAAADLVILDSLDHFKLHPINEPVQAHFTTTINNPDVQFTNTSIREDDLNWEFGDGNTSTLENPNHTYAGSGTYTVTLIAGNDCASDTVSQEVIVEVNALDELTEYGVIFREFNDHFEIQTTTKPIYYEIYSLDGKFIISDQILTSDFQRIMKNQKNGIILLKNEHIILLRKTFVKL